MADDEQFSLCWNNFNSNLSAGFHESLCRGDLVDVTLAAEGQFIKAHRLVLTVCSPFFQDMFTKMPINQHAFVFLKDVSHSALKDLIQFMYCGEVNVKQNALPAFISTAEALQIKGLTDADTAPSHQTQSKPSTPPQQQISTHQTTVSQPKVQIKPHPIQISKYNKPDDSEIEKVTQKPSQIVIQTSSAPPPMVSIGPPTIQVQVQTQQQQQTQPTQEQIISQILQPQKRVAQKNISGRPTKKSKLEQQNDQLEISREPLHQPQTTTIETKSNVTDYIDLAISTKSEPEYIEDTGNIETVEQEETYLEDESFEEIKYDENYFTENNETAGVNINESDTSNVQPIALSATIKEHQSFTEPYVNDNIDQNLNEPQITELAIYSKTSRNKIQLIYGGQPFIFEKILKLPTGLEKKYWRCNQWWNQKCRSRVYTINDLVTPLNRFHTHEEIVKRKKRVRKIKLDKFDIIDDKMNF